MNPAAPQSAVPLPPAGPAPGSGVVGGLKWSLLFGNFVIGCGVMCLVGTLNELATSLGVSVAVAGQLIAVGAAMVCFGAPLLAGWFAGLDRRRLLAASLVWYAAGHALSALMPSFATLLPVRAATVLAAAVFTPQAAAAIGHLATREQRGPAITFIFLGWSMASVVGVPLAAWVGGLYGWRAAFGGIAVLSIVAAAWVMRAVPDGVKPAALSPADWKAVLRHPALMAMVMVTALSAAGQFTLFSYFAPYYRQAFGATAAEIGLLLVWFGAFGLLGNLLVSRWINRLGADRSVAITIGLMLVSLLVWPLAGGFYGMALVLLPWGIGCFSSNSAQQARLGMAAPALAPALMALNTSAIYLGQATGASSGGWLISHHGYGLLAWTGAVWLVAALALSRWAGRQRVPATA